MSLNCVVSKITNVPIPVNDILEEVIWMFFPDGDFLVKTVRKIMIKLLHTVEQNVK